MQSQLESAEVKKELDLSNAVKDIEKQRDQLINDLRNKDTERALLENSLHLDFKNKLEHKEEAIKLKDDEIERLKDYKQKLSTKMIGETLEIHCETEFNKLRATVFKMPILRKTTMPQEVPKAIISFGRPMPTAMR